MTTSTAVLYCDSRWGEIDNLVYGFPDEIDMRISELVRSSAGYIVTKKTVNGVETETEEGTAFFVGVPSTVDRLGVFIHLVTARHVIYDRKDNLLPNLYLRLNVKGGAKRDIQLLGKWRCSKNKNVDVAVMYFRTLLSGFDVTFAPYVPPNQEEALQRENVFVDDKAIEDWDIGIGDEVRVVGLYVNESGKKRIEPIVRGGILSAMPAEQVTVTRSDQKGGTETLEFNAYLIEVRSLGGLSGSPVYVMVEESRNPRGPVMERQVLIENKYRAFLLGILRAHTRYRDSSSVHPIVKDWKEFSDGFAYVTPAKEIIKVLYGREIVKERKEVEDELQRARAKFAEFTEDSAHQIAEVEMDFSALKKASRKVSQPAKGKKEKEKL